jgi:hypothetical protein
MMKPYRAVLHTARSAKPVVASAIPNGLMSCVDGSCDARAFRSFGERGQVQSCVRPVAEAILPLALMVSADLVPFCFADI